MSVQIDIRLKRANKVYNPGDLIKGIVCLDCPTDYKHEGITLTMDGIVNLNTSPQNVGLIDTNILKPVQIAFAVVEIAGRSKIPAGITEIPFEIPLQPRQNRVLYETFHGVYININYRLKCDIKRSFLAKDISKELEFVVEHKDHIHDSSLLNKLKNSKVNFTITPNTLLFHSHNNVPVPHFSVEVVLHSTYCDITVPFTGELQIIEKVTTIESIELQLVRVETCGSARNFARECITLLLEYIAIKLTWLYFYGVYYSH